LAKLIEEMTASAVARGAYQRKSVKNGAPAAQRQPAGAAIETRLASEAGVSNEINNGEISALHYFFGVSAALKNMLAAQNLA